MPDPESRLSSKRSQKEFEELLLKDILIEVEASKLDFWEQKAMELADQPGYAPTPKQRAAFEERLDLEVKRIQKQKRQFSQIAEPFEDAQALQDSLESQDSQHIPNTQDYQISPKASDRRRKRQRILRKVGSIAAILVLFVFMTMYHTVEAFAAGVDRFIATVVPEDGAEELRVEDKKDAGVDFDVKDYVGMYFPEWVPRGYVLSKIESYADIVKFTYIDKNADVIIYKIVEAAHSMYVDDEDIIENQIYILDTWARVVEIDGLIYVIWEDSNYIYTVSGKVELKENLITLVERCVKIEQEN